MYHLIFKDQKNDAKLNSRIEIIEQVFKNAGKELTLHQTTHAGHAKEIAASLTAGGEFAHLIAMGGDGTLHEVLNGIEDTENCTLGLIPYGTGNDFAESAGIPNDVKYAAETIAFRAPCPIDYIELECGLRSINAIGMGIDVDVLRRTYAAGDKGQDKYLKAFMQSLKEYKSTSFKVSWDGGEEQTRTGLIACMGNGRQFGGGIKMFPEAKIDDGYMDFAVVDYMSKLKTVFAFMKLKAGKIHKVKSVTYVKCKSATITPIDCDKTIQAEGELYEDVPIKAHLISGKLKFYLPKND